MKRIGIISDTHGAIHPNVHKVFKDVDLIIHAGDIVGEDILTELRTISDVKAVYGNMDTDIWSKGLEEELLLDIEGIKINVSHKTEIPTGICKVVVRGHTHIPEISSTENLMYINPGCSNKEKSIPIGKPSVAILEIDNNRLDAKIVFI